jgi:hypothetical protein
MLLDRKSLQNPMRSSLHYYYYYNGRFCSLLATYISEKAGGSAVHYVGHNLCMCGVLLDADQICFKFLCLSDVKFHNMDKVGSHNLIVYFRLCRWSDIC